MLRTGIPNSWTARNDFNPVNKCVKLVFCSFFLSFKRNPGLSKRELLDVELGDQKFIY